MKIVGDEYTYLYFIYIYVNTFYVTVYSILKAVLEAQEQGPISFVADLIVFRI